MTARPFLIDEKFKADCERLRVFAESPKNWYLFDETNHVPGDNPQYVLEFDSYRAVFTITHAPKFKPKPFRHLTVSVPGPGDAYPHPLVVVTLAHYLGFTGATLDNAVVKEPGPWGIGLDEDDECAIVQQEYEVPNVN